LRAKSISLSEGLSQSTVQAVFQDRQGVLWLGTRDGLNRFEGYDLTTHWPDPLDQHAITGKWISDITEDADGRLWIATEEDGVSRYNRSEGSFRSFRNIPDDSTSLGSDFVLSIYADSDGTVWVGTVAGGLNRFVGDEEGFNNIAIPDPSWRGDAWIFDLLESTDGDLLIATDGAGLFSMDLGTEIPVRQNVVDPVSGDSLDAVVFDMVYDSEGWLWMATPFGLVGYEAETGLTRHYVHDERDRSSIGDDLVYSVEVDNQDQIWAGTAEHGVFILNASRTEFAQLGDNDEGTADLLDEPVHTLLRDMAGDMWIGTESLGVILVHQSVDVFSIAGNEQDLSGGMLGRDVWSILEDREGDLWVGSQDVGIVRISSATGSATRISNSLDENSTSVPTGLVTASFEDKIGRLWFGVEDFGVVRSDVAKEQFEWFEFGYEEETGLSNELPHVFMEDSKGRLWMGTLDGALNRYDEISESFERYIVHPDTFSGWNTVMSLAEAPDGTLWVGTLDGLAAFDVDAASFEYFHATPDDPMGLSDPNIYSIHVTSDDELWLGTDLGLNRMARNPTGLESDWAFERFTVSSGLPNDVVYAVLPGSRNLIWLSTNRGISAFDTETHTVRSFDPGDGISGFEFNQGASFVAPDGVLYFGGIGGVTKVRTNQFVESTYQPPVVLTEFRTYDDVLNRDMGDGDAIVLSHDQNFLTLAFAAVEFRNPEKVRYRYYLEGIEDEWRDAAERRYVSYSGIAPGEYTFHINSTNRDGLWSSNPTSISISIRPPFWGTWWFRLAFLSSLVASGFAGAWVWRQAGLKKLDRQHQDKIEIQRRIGDRLEAERVHLARELHDGPIQSLQLSGFQMTQIADTDGEKEKQERMDNLRLTISSVIQDLRNICGRMRPPALVHFGLGRAVQSYSEQFLEKYSDINLHLDLPQGRTRLDTRSRLGLFRICQEALSNVAKHAGPCHVTITIREEKHGVSLEIEDDGVGFKPPQAWEMLARDHHFGLLGASERADSLNGTLKVESRPGVGTKISVRAPIPSKDSKQNEKTSGGVFL